MTVRSVGTIATRLAEAGVRYLIVGGFAAVAHGVNRFTASVDLVLDPDVANVRAALAAFAALGYGPRAPVALEEYARPEKRAEWAREKHMLVFTLAGARHPATEIDLFLEPPLDFAAAHARALRETLDGVPVWFVSRRDLITLKRAAGRPRDLEDVAALESLGEDSDSHE